MVVAEGRLEKVQSMWDFEEQRAELRLGRIPLLTMA